MKVYVVTQTWHDGDVLHQSVTKNKDYAYIWYRGMLDVNKEFVMENKMRITLKTFEI